MSPLPVTPCDPIWHVSSHSSGATLLNAIHLLQVQTYRRAIHVLCITENSRVQQTEIKHHRCQKDETDDQTAGREDRLTELLVDALGTHTGQDSASNCLKSFTQKRHSTP